MKTLHQIGERGIIKRLKNKIRTGRRVKYGIGDDAAVLSYTKKKYQLLTTDMLIEGVHFDKKRASYYQIGRKSLAVSISDIAAMGGIPKYAVISAGLPKRFSLQALDGMLHGIVHLADEFKIDIVGGDTVRAEKITLNIALLGEVDKGDLLLRSGAKRGDLVFVTGTLGRSKEFKQYNFIPRVSEAQELIKRFKPTSAIDVSDGLVQDLERICDASRVGALLFEELIPLAHNAKLSNALYDGEDFELLFTMSLRNARSFYRKHSFPISCIGKIVERKRGIRLLSKNTKEKKLTHKGFNHF